MGTLLNEECLSASGGSKTLGFVNPLFYKNPDAFTDITKGSNAIGENAKSGWSWTEGWDAATGLGTPKFTSLQSVVRKACSGGNEKNGCRMSGAADATSQERLFDLLTSLYF